MVRSIGVLSKDAFYLLLTLASNLNNQQKQQKFKQKSLCSKKIGEEIK
jgi:hypothetical protein